jgi:hypothetical protein
MLKRRVDENQATLGSKRNKGPYRFVAIATMNRYSTILAKVRSEYDGVIFPKLARNVSILFSK